MTHFIKASAVALAVGLLGANYAEAQHTTQGDAQQGDRARTSSAKSMTAAEYVQKSAIGDEFEIESSKLALQKAQDPAIKSFAQEMVDEHTTSTNKLKEAAQSAKINLAARQKLDSQHQQTLTQLRAASGPQFDQAYIRAQLLGHREALNLQKAYSQSGDNQALKAHAQEVESVVQHHLAQAERLAQVRVNDTNQQARPNDQQQPRPGNGSAGGAGAGR
jgi:putative membrane protein